MALYKMRPSSRAPPRTSGSWQRTTIEFGMNSCCSMFVRVTFISERNGTVAAEHYTFGILANAVKVYAHILCANRQLSKSAGG